MNNIDADLNNQNSENENKVEEVVENLLIKQTIDNKIVEAKTIALNAKHNEAIVVLLDTLNMFLENAEKENLEIQIKANILLMLGNQYFMTEEFDYAEKYFNQVISLNEIDSSLKEIGRSYHSIGNIYALQKLWSKALENYELSIDKNEEANHLLGLGGTFHNIRIILSQTINIKKRLKYYKKRLKFYEKEGKNKLFGYFYHELALLYNDYGKKKNELEFLEKALASKLEHKIEYELANTYYFLAGFHDDNDDEDKAFEYYISALELMLKHSEFEYAGTTVQYLELSLDECTDNEQKQKAINLLKIVEEQNIFEEKRKIFDGIEIGEYNAE